MSRLSQLSQVIETAQPVLPIRPQLSIVIPVLDDAVHLQRLLRLLGKANTHADLPLEILVIDGGSTDHSAAIALELGARVIRTEASRGVQLNAGYRAAQGTYLWLLHADSQPDAGALRWLCACRNVDWGRFDIRFDDGGPGMRLLAGMMNRRSRLTGICTGDQGIFVHRRLLEVIGGVPEQALMEDIELSRRLHALCRPTHPVLLTIQTSARRWQHNGWWRTVLAMWHFRFRYWRGESAETLAQDYYPARVEQ